MRATVNRDHPLFGGAEAWPRHACLLLVLVALLWADAARAERHVISVAVLELGFEGEVSSGVRAALSRKLRDGLGATGMRVLPDRRLKQVLGPGASTCAAGACWRRVAGKLGCRFLAGGTVVGEDRSYTIELFLADGYTGEVAARVRRRCDICGLRAVGETMDLVASALSAKVQAIGASPARISVRTSPPGATVLVDGDPMGTSPLEFDLPAGTHKITARASGFLSATRSVSTVAGVEERVAMALIRAAPRRSPRQLLGWTAVGAGVVGLGVAATLFILDGGQAGCSGEDRIPGGQCPELRKTTAGAWTSATLGAVAVAAGVYLLLRRGERPQQALLLDR